MLTSIEGIYHKGQIQLMEDPKSVPEGTRVIVTFMEGEQIDLKAQGIEEKEAQILRESFASFSEDWESPEMSIYDDYDAAQSNS
ncbi:hypothetical protein PCC7418_3721 [Halothece sp. PCC 7418]|uniref:hypothetical protein n=1 Tax=Halothece sp. (strain PCC 7418) TaxID=65093 RepID=UPI0002A07306|nr:hypothetical protein [Halothece sp. PCC 7418]AFZ45825.1 hypothetical protein PCC7418_3721 [Halothece sp. PCC 7418]